MKNVIVYGAGEFGTLIANVLSYLEEYNIAAYGDDDPQKIGKFVEDTPILGQDDLLNFAKENDIEIIEMPEDEYLESKTLSVYILALSPRNLVAMKGYPNTIDLLSASGCKISLFSGFFIV